MHLDTLSWDTRRVHLPFRSPFAFAGRAVRNRDSVLLRVVWPGRCLGEGEAAPLPGFIDAPLGAIEAAIVTLLARATPVTAALDTFMADGPDALRTALDDAWHGVDLNTPAQRLARAAVETALADAASRMAGLPLARWLHPRAAPVVCVNATLGRGPVAARRAALDRLVHEGFRVLKVKLGDGGLPAEARLLEDLLARNHDIQLRFDFNRSLPPGTLSALDAFVGLPVQYVEEPVAGDFRDLAAAAPRVAVPLAADESLLHGNPDTTLIGAGIRHFVLKPNFLGGPLTALARARSAGARGVRCTVTTALDSAIGRTMALQVAAAIEGAGWGTGAHGLATARFLAADVALGPAPQGSLLVVPAAVGLGLGAPGGGEG